MTILNDREILELLDTGRVELSPLDRDLQIQPCSIDLRVGTDFLAYHKHYPHREDLLGSVTLGRPDDVLYEKRRAVETSSKQLAMPIQPGEFLLGQTVERIKLPNDVLARVEGRSSVGRCGLFVHVTAGFIDPGFEGHITLEFYNASPGIIWIPTNFRICQIALHKLNSFCLRPYGAERGSKYVDNYAAGVQAPRTE